MSFWFRYTNQKPSNNFSRTYDQMFGEIDKKYLTKSLTEVISSIKVEEVQKNIAVYLSYDFGNNNVLTFHKFVNDGNKGILYGYALEKQWREQEINLDEFLSFCADFIIGKVWFKLSTQYEKYLPELMRESIYDPNSVISHIRHLTVGDAYFLAENLIPE